MFRKILCAIDFSTTSEEALRVAAELAAGSRGQLTILHVCQMPAWTLPEGVVLAGPETVERVLSEGEAALRTRKQAIVAAHKIEVKTILATGVPHDEIVRIAAKDECDLVVVGTHGRTGIAHFLLGSVAEKVIRTSQAPVLTVRGRRAVA